MRTGNQASVSLKESATYEGDKDAALARTPRNH
jgi:hypothetical protein